MAVHEGQRFVYFIGEEDGPVKIGESATPVARLRSLQTGNPRRLRLERVLIGSDEAEGLIHEQWREFALVAPGRTQDSPGTEWFRAEIREQLYPVVELAASEQGKALSGCDQPLSDLEKIIREAHIALGIELVARDEVRLLSKGCGYVVQRAG